MQCAAHNALQCFLFQQSPITNHPSAPSRPQPAVQLSTAQCKRHLIPHFIALDFSVFHGVVYVCNICTLQSNAMQCSAINCIAHTSLFVPPSSAMCTVTCYECTDDAPAVDTLTDPTLICTVTETRVTASAYRNTWHQLFKGKRLSKTDLLMKKGWDHPSQMTNT